MAITKIQSSTVSSEYNEQVTLFHWSFIMSKEHPELELLFAIPNGAKLPWGRTNKGKRYSAEAIKLIRSGLKPGVPDIFLPVARQGYNGLFIELKYNKNKPSGNQKQMIDKLSKQGYLVSVCYGFEEAKNVICNYLSIPVT